LSGALKNDTNGLRNTTRENNIAMTSQLQTKSVTIRIVTLSQ